MIFLISQQRELFMDVLKLIFSLSAAPTKRFVSVKTLFDLIFYLLKVADLSHIRGEEQSISVDGLFMDSAGCQFVTTCLDLWVSFGPEFNILKKASCINIYV